MKQIKTGNAIQEGQGKNRGWFVGSFIQSDNSLQTNNDVEVKWGIHPKGEKRLSKAIEGEATSISILVNGKYGITFEDTDEILLSNEGDYIMWSPNLPHNFESYEDSVIVTIRWPSLSSVKN